MGQAMAKPRAVSANETRKTTTATRRSNRNAVSRISGSSAATTSAASEIAFSSEKNPMAWEATSRRTIIRPKETRTIPPAIASAVAGAAAEWIPSELKQKNPNAASAIEPSTLLATPRV